MATLWLAHTTALPKQVNTIIFAKSRALRMIMFSWCHLFSYSFHCNMLVVLKHVYPKKIKETFENLS